LSLRFPVLTQTLFDRARLSYLVKAFETSRFRPTYAEANVGHPSWSYPRPRCLFHTLAGVPDTLQLADVKNLAKVVRVVCSHMRDE
jgi:hypothetical protein